MVKEVLKRPRVIAVGGHKLKVVMSEHLDTDDDLAGRVLYSKGVIEIQVELYS